MNEVKKLKLYLVRGLPGSGKSTYAKKEFVNKHGFLHFENDMYFMHNGKYEFDSSKYKDAANWCYSQTDKALAAGRDVVVSNVFITFKSTRRYLQLAKKYNAEFKIFRKDKDYGNMHDVPENVLAQFKRLFQDIPGEVQVDMKKHKQQSS